MDGEEGTHLAIDYDYDYDVIVLDVMLPRRDGFVVLKALRMQKSTPVIMLTAHDHVNNRVRVLREGARRLSHQALLVPRTRRIIARAGTPHARAGIHAHFGGRSVCRSDRPTRDTRRRAARSHREGVSAVEHAGAAPRRYPLEDGDHRTRLGSGFRKSHQRRRNGDQAAARQARRPFRKLLHTVRDMGYVLEIREARDTLEAREDARPS